MQRDSKLLSIRPELQLPKAERAIESFQNDTLRPILKFQNDVTLRLLVHCKNYKSEYEKNYNQAEFEAYLSKFIQKHIALKNQLIGCVIGHMTSHELDFYLANSKELNKRILTMQLKRFADTLHIKEIKVF